MCCADLKNNFLKIKNIILKYFKIKITLNRDQYYNFKHAFFGHDLSTSLLLQY
jgi:hypothetical protein